MYKYIIFNIYHTVFLRATSSNSILSRHANSENFLKYLSKSLANILCILVTVFYRIYKLNILSLYQTDSTYFSRSKYNSQPDIFQNLNTALFCFVIYFIFTLFPFLFIFLLYLFPLLPLYLLQNE